MVNQNTQPRSVATDKEQDDEDAALLSHSIVRASRSPAPSERWCETALSGPLQANGGSGAHLPRTAKGAGANCESMRTARSGFAGRLFPQTTDAVEGAGCEPISGEKLPRGRAEEGCAQDLLTVAII